MNSLPCPARARHDGSAVQRHDALDQREPDAKTALGASPAHSRLDEQIEDVVHERLDMPIPLSMTRNFAPTRLSAFNARGRRRVYFAALVRLTTTCETCSSPSTNTGCSARWTSSAPVVVNNGTKRINCPTHQQHEVHKRLAHPDLADRDAAHVEQVVHESRGA